MRSVALLALSLVACTSAVLELPPGQRPRESPPGPSPPPSATAVVDVSSAGGVACAVDASGAVYCWGRWMGFVGSRVQDIGPTPTRVAGIDRAVAVDVSDDHACAARADGAVLCWGWDSQSQVGAPHAVINEPYTFYAEAQRVEGVDDAVDVAVGWLHSCALRAGGAVKCWGSNGLASLGDAARVGMSAAALDVVGVRDAVAIDAGSEDTCAVLRSGELWCWGSGAYDALGPRDARSWRGGSRWSSRCSTWTWAARGW